MTCDRPFGTARSIRATCAPRQRQARRPSAFEDNIRTTTAVPALRRGHVIAGLVVSHGLHEHLVGRHALRDQRTSDRAGTCLRTLEVPDKLAFAGHAGGA